VSARWRGPPRVLNLTADAWRGLRTAYADQIKAVPWRTRFRYAIAGRQLGMLERVQQRATASLPAPQRPLFILGHWRSGTTLLHELLAVDPQFSYPDTYACMNPQHFVMSRRGALQVSGDKQVQRPMDGMVVSSTSPQEDEFALLGLGARSPYEAALFPNAFARAMQTVHLDPQSADEKRRFDSACSRFLAQVASTAPGKTLLLKSPPHAFRLARLRALFPDARFVHIVRDPHEVASSTRKMWRELQALYALTPPPHAAAFTDIVETLRAYGDAVPLSLAGAEWHELSFASLVADPCRELARLYEVMGLGSFEAVRAQAEAYMRRTAGHQRNVHPLSDAERALVTDRCGNLLRRLAGIA
jgi:hypothetical protein